MRRSLAPLLVVAGLTFLAGLGAPAITDSDEAFYAEAAREMIESGDWLTPTFNYEPRFQKPILYYWLTAATFGVTGPGPGAARLWSALAGVGLVFVTAGLARRWYDDDTALVAGAIVATSFGYVALGRMALPDLPLAFFITGTIGAALIAVGDRVPRPRRWLLLAAAAAALGFLTKGPLAVVIPGLVVAPIVAIERRTSRLNAADLVLAAVVFVAVAVPWYFAMGWLHGARLPEGLLHRRQPRALRHRPLQRAAAVVVLRPGHGRRPGPVGAVPAAGRGRARPHGAAPWRRRQPRNPAGDLDPACRWRC